MAVAAIASMKVDLKIEGMLIKVMLVGTDVCMLDYELYLVVL